MKIISTHKNRTIQKQNMFSSARMLASSCSIHTWEVPMKVKLRGEGYI